MSRIARSLSALVVAGSLALSAGTAQADENVMVVFDGSNSMWGQIDGTAKIEIARGVMENLLGDWTEERAVGLMAYGHRRRGDCTDIETLVQPGEAARSDILARINAITPTGKTPLSDAVEQAAVALSYTDQPATVVLISDGLESCDRDPCALAESLEKAGVQFTAHVVGFGLGGDEDTASLSCIAEKTGGQFISASNADELGAALSTVGTAVAAAPEPEPVAEPEPEPELPEITVSGPETVLTGADFEVAYTGTVVGNDYVTIVAMGADEGTHGSYKNVRDKPVQTLRAPADPGMYELRYVLREGAKTMARAPIEVTVPEITVSGPETVLTGADFEVAYTGAVAGNDYVTIVPMGADEGTHGSYKNVKDKPVQTLRAPADPGMYELRYVLREGAKTMARAPIEATMPEVTLEAPDQIRLGESLRVRWSSAVNPQDYINMVPMGSADDTFGSYHSVGDHGQHDMRPVDAAGMYELRYMLRSNNRVIARRTVEVLPADAALETGASLDAPAAAATGATVEVGWSVESDSADQRITLAKADQAIFTWIEAVKIAGDPPVQITLPDEPGSYELRFLDVSSQKVLARQVISVE